MNKKNEQFNKKKQDTDINKQENNQTANDQNSPNNENNTIQLQQEINDLNNQLNEKDNQIVELKKRIDEYNKNYLNEITKKTNEAQEKINSKIEEIQSKYESELSQVKKYALKDKILELLDIINNFEMVINSPVNDPAVSKYVQGFKMFSNMFQNYLTANNIKAIIPKLGDEYDYKSMNAFDTQESKEYQPNKVIKVVKNGYMLHDLVILPATVLVSK